MKDFFRHNGLLILIVALLLALITMVASLFLGGFSNPFSNLIGIVTTPVRNGINAFVGWSEGIYSYTFEYDSLKAENEALKAENAALKIQAREGEAASRENENFRHIIGLREKRKELVWESATVTGRSTSNWESTLTISKGSSMGVAPDDCVVDAYGNLVGVISEVGVNWSTLITLVDSDLEMGGLLARTDGAAILEGDFALMGEGKLKLSYLPENSALIAGEMVLTSGKGGVFPAGLTVGHIQEVLTEASGMSRYAIVVPETELGSLKQVFVIKSFDIIE